MIIMQKMMEQSHIKVFKIIAQKEYGSRDKAECLLEEKLVCWKSFVIVLNTPTSPPCPGPQCLFHKQTKNISLFPPETETGCAGAFYSTVNWRCVDNSWNLSSSWNHATHCHTATVPECETQFYRTRPGQAGSPGLARLLPGVFIGEPEFEWQCQLSELKAVLGIKSLLWPH